MPRYSILIPTINRPDTLKYALQTALNQTADDYEVVVSNNGGNPDVSAVVQEAESSRVREVKTPAVCTMSENWEFGIRHCNGEYITVLGDDDGVMPELVSYTDNVIKVSNTKLFSWPTHLYWWKNAHDHYRKNTLHIRGFDSDEIITLSSDAVLEGIYSWSIPFTIVPLIYHAFVHRSIIEKMQEEHGYYCRATAADIFSGPVNLHYSPTFINSRRPLGISGLSGHSTGGRITYGDKLDDTYEIMGGKRPMHPSVFKSRHNTLVLVDSLAIAHDLLYPGHPKRQLDMMKVVYLLIGDLYAAPEHYDQTVSDIRRFAELNRLDISGVGIPDKATAFANAATKRLGPRHPIGPILGDSRIYSGLVVDGDKCGIQNIADAVRMASAVTSNSPV